MPSGGFGCDMTEYNITPNGDGSYHMKPAESPIGDGPVFGIISFLAVVGITTMFFEECRCLQYYNPVLGWEMEDKYAILPCSIYLFAFVMAYLNTRLNWIVFVVMFILYLTVAGNK